MKLLRRHAVLKKMKKNDWDNSGYATASPAERISFIWDLTAEIWSLTKNKNVEQRLQRHIARLIKK